MNLSHHRTVARLYFWLSLGSVLLGVLLSLVMRFHLVYPSTSVKLFQFLWPTRAQGGVMTPEL